MPPSTPSKPVAEPPRETTRKTLPINALGTGSLDFRIVTDESGQPTALDSGDPSLVRYGIELWGATGSVVARGTLELPDLASHRTTREDSIGGSADLETDWKARRSELEALPHGGAKVLLPAEANQLLPPLVATSVGCFALPCPSCGSPLVDCMDRELLASRGLPMPSDMPDTVLICAEGCRGTAIEDAPGSEARNSEETAEAPDRGSARLFCASDPLPDALRHAGCLGLEDLRQLLASEDRSGNGVGLPSDIPWTLLTDRETPFLVLETQGQTLDRFADLLGGRPQAEPSTPPNDCYLMSLQGSGLDAIEVFTLKLTLFSQILETVAAYHRVLERPHLDLHPGQWAVDRPSETGRDLPGYWSFRARMVGNSGARPRELTSGIRWISPPATPRALYASPALRRACLVTSHTGELMAERLVETEGKWRLEAKLHDPNGVFPNPSREDWVLVRLRGLRIGDVSTLLLRRDPRRLGDRGALVLTSEPFELDRAAVQRWESVGRVPLGEVEYRVLPTLGKEDDFYALGMLLLRLLLTNDGQDLASLETRLGVGLQQPTGGMGLDEASAEADIGPRIQETLSGQAHLVAADQVFFCQHDRNEKRPNAIPKELWEEALALALSWVIGYREGVSFRESPALDDPGGAMDHVGDLLRRCRGLLFRLQPVHLEVHSVVAEMLATLD